MRFTPRLQIKMNEIISHLPAVVMLVVGFDVLLGMPWIKSVLVCLNIAEVCLLCKDQEHAYQQL